MVALRLWSHLPVILPNTDRLSNFVTITIGSNNGDKVIIKHLTAPGNFRLALASSRYFAQPCSYLRSTAPEGRWVTLFFAETKVSNLSRRPKV